MKRWLRVPIAALIASSVGVVGGTGVVSATAPCQPRFCILSRAVQGLVGAPGGPPGAIVVIQQGSRSATVTAGVADVATNDPITDGDEMRLASVSKAYSGAAALALVSAGRLSLSDTIGKWLPGLPAAWSGITLAQLLNHTSRIPDFSKQPAFIDDLLANLQNPPAPAALLSSVENLPLVPANGSNYGYSNSDNVIVGLMVQAVTGTSYEDALQALVLNPLGLGGTSFPTGSVIPVPFMHGYEVDPQLPPKDVSSLFAAGWTWAAGAVVATPRDASTFIRGYVAGALFNGSTRRAQFQFIPGNSEPPGPGINQAGLGLFRYSTRCGTVFGHTGNTAGYTQFAAANADGSRSVTVSVNAQITPTTNPGLFGQLRKIDELGVCAALSSR